MRFTLIACQVLGCSSSAEAPVVTPQQDGGLVEETAKTVSAVSFHDVYTKVLAPTCGNGYCHGGVAGGWSVKEDEAATYDQLVGPKSTMCEGLDRVSPNDPEKSALYLKVRGGFGTICEGKRMPPSGELTTEQLDLVRAWIAAGAPK